MPADRIRARGRELGPGESILPSPPRETDHSESRASIFLEKRRHKKAFNDLIAKEHAAEAKIFHEPKIEDERLEDSPEKPSEKPVDKVIFF